MYSFILTQDDLIVIRAVVRFWREENGSDPDLLQFYSGATGNLDKMPIDVRGLTSRLQQVVPRYLICRQPDLIPTTDQMYRSHASATEDATGQDEIVATVLVAESN